MYGPEGIHHLLQRVVMGRGFLAFDQDSVEHAMGEVAADRSDGPIVPRRDRTGQEADLGRQRGPDDDRVQVAGVVGKIDALAGVGLALDPARLAWMDAQTGAALGR